MKSGTARLRTPGGTGTAWLCWNEYALTAAHCVEVVQQVHPSGQNVGLGYAYPPEKITLEFQAEDSALWSAKTESIPVPVEEVVRFDRGLDAALLRLSAEKIPQHAERIGFAVLLRKTPWPTGLEAIEWSAFGFPLAHEPGLTLSGRITDPNGRVGNYPAIQLLCYEGGMGELNGASGSAVCCDGIAVALIRYGTLSQRVIFAASLEHIAAAFPEVGHILKAATPSASWGASLGTKKSGLAPEALTDLSQKRDALHTQLISTTDSAKKYSLIRQIAALDIYLKGGLEALSVVMLLQEELNFYREQHSITADVTEKAAIREQMEKAQLNVAEDQKRVCDVMLSRMPWTAADLFGREAELQRLDKAWADPHTNVVVVAAWGGVGKSALVNRWLGLLAQNSYRPAERVFGWSFNGQGTTGAAGAAPEVSGDEFLHEALAWFGDNNPQDGSPRSKGERLARLIRSQRTLPILDGLEPFQSEAQAGRLKDAGLSTLLRELAALNPGLAVVTTRHPLADLEMWGATTSPHLELPALAPAAGAALLHKFGLWPSEELEQAAKDFDGNALALTLLGAYLRDVHGGDVRRRDKVSLLQQDEIDGNRAAAVMASYEEWFGQGRELAALRVIGLFDRPAPPELVKLLLAAPAIPGLTYDLVNLSDVEWNKVLSRLRRCQLLADRPDQPQSLDTHPLVREYFGRQLQQRFPEAWREANNRLYEHLTRTAPDLPQTLEELIPLYAAIVHGCRAGRHEEALRDVYYKRIVRGAEGYSAKILGAVGSDLAALSSFFEHPWDTPADTLGPAEQQLVLANAGFYFLVRTFVRGGPATAARLEHGRGSNWFSSKVLDGSSPHRG